MKHSLLLVPLAWLAIGGLPARADTVDLSRAVVVIRPGERPNAEKMAATILLQEVEKRTGIRLPVHTSWPQGMPAIAITSTGSVEGWGRAVPAAQTRPEGYRLFVEQSKRSEPIVWIIGADARGALFGAGQLLRRLNWAKASLSVTAPLDLTTSPAYPIRGHQLGYRTQANSYDAWTTAQFEQYIRELTYFGVNSIEGIPFHDDRKTPVMKVPRREMNRAIGDI